MSEPQKQKIKPDNNNNGEIFKPYIPAEKSLPELTVTAVILGILIGIVFGAANAYIGLKVGMTVSASIPAAVISMAIIRGVLKRNSILENNIVQTIGSAGESLAAGVIFTIPALILWKIQPDLLYIFLLSILGGVLGVLMMIPVRRFLIVKEHGKLPFPEGTACAEVLIAGEKGGTGAKIIFTALGIGGLYKVLSEGFKLWPASIESAIPSLKTVISMEAIPSLLGVGFIIGPKIAAYMLAGGILGWFVLIPLISYFGIHIGVPISPARIPIAELDATGIWKYYIRYIGAGAVAFGGIVGLLKTFPAIFSAFKSAIGGLKTGIEKHKILRTDLDLPLNIIIGGIFVIFLIITFVPSFKLGVVGSICAIVFGFFFVTVSSRIVGLVGSSSNPVSGMTIGTLFATALILKAVGFTGTEGMIATLGVGAIVCIALAIAGDTSQDLKTGYLLGATPKAQQIGELIGVVSSAVFIGAIVLLLNKAYGIGSQALPAPQATLMSMIIEGTIKGTLQWDLIIMGAGAALVIELLGIGSLPFAVGLYLPLGLSVPIMFGGIISWILKKKEKDPEELKKREAAGILIASGLIAGDALIGVILAGFIAGDIDFIIYMHWGVLLGFLFFAWYLVHGFLKKNFIHILIAAILVAIMTGINLGLFYQGGALLFFIVLTWYLGDGVLSKKTVTVV